MNNLRQGTSKNHSPTNHAVADVDEQVTIVTYSALPKVLSVIIVRKTGHFKLMCRSRPKVLYFVDEQ